MKVKIFSMAFIIVLLNSALFASDIYVKGYYKKDGTYVAPHYRTHPNGYSTDNYSNSTNTTSSNSYTYRNQYQSTYKSQYSTSSNSSYKPNNGTGKTWVEGYTRSDGKYVRGYWRNK